MSNPAVKPSSASLVSLHPDVRPDKYPLADDICTIGRSSSCHIVVPQTAISRLHARLTLLDDGIQLEDLGSTNGTTVNGRRVTRERLRAGDEIGFNTVRMRVVASGEMEPVRVEAVRRSSQPAKPSSSAWWPVWIAGVAVAAIVAISVI